MLLEPLTQITFATDIFSEICICNVQIIHRHGLCKSTAVPTGSQDASGSGLRDTGPREEWPKVAKGGRTEGGGAEGGGAKGDRERWGRGRLGRGG